MAPPLARVRGQPARRLVAERQRLARGPARIVDAVAAPEVDVPTAEPDPRRSGQDEVDASLVMTMPDEPRARGELGEPQEELLRPGGLLGQEILPPERAEAAVR